MDELERQFLTKASSNQVDPDIAREIWRQIASFAAYAFCKAHSASFAQLSYQVAFLRAYHPAEFMAAVLTNQGGFYSTMAYIEEARRMGIRILLPDIQAGKWEYAAEGPHAIRVGLMQIKNIAEKHWDPFFQEREKRKFSHFGDFFLRSPFQLSDLEAFIKCGACDGFGLRRPQLFWLLKSMFPSVLKQRNRAALIGSDILRIPSVPRLRDYTEKEKLYGKWD